LEEFTVGQQALSDQQGAHLNLGVIYGNLARLDKAEEEYQAALAIDRHFVPARINLAMLYDQKQDKAKAEEQFRAAIEELKQQLADTENQAKSAASAMAAAKESTGRTSPTEAVGRIGNPSYEAPPHVPVFAIRPSPGERPLDPLLGQLRQQLGETHYSLGLLLAENEKRLHEAAETLAAAAKLMPGNARMHYNLGLARQRTGQTKPAEEALMTACRLAPAEPDYVNALAVYYTQQGDWPKALVCAEQLVRLEPGNRAFRSLLEMVRRQGKQ
jgi:Flp pilus assembly protein TadD